MNSLTIRTFVPGAVLIVVLSGCAIGNGTICGPQTPLAYCDREAYQKLLYPTPTRDEWEKESANVDLRRKDWMDCGGSYIGEYGVSEDELNGRTAREVFDSKFDDLQYCMMKKGYHYTGTCEGEIASQYPACRTAKK
ncbi:hypothetical protein [Bordetella genomosp. 1]|uniref:hypothetical protein n=1 Tax=Bordetella genomosp. 1 TaxID=1395607 RepID=UPI0011785753|nr:hypothetical protein [Bordetella genomosp. 1]